MEQTQIKGNKSSYFKKSENKTIETISKIANLGVNSSFNVGDVVNVLSETEYNNLIETANTDDAKEIVKLNETITRLKKELNTLTDDNNKLKATNKELLNTINNNETDINKLQQENTELTNTIRSKDKELTKYTAIDIDKLQQDNKNLETTNKELLGKVVNRDEYIVYLELLQTDYKLLVQYLNTSLTLQKQRNFIDRVINKDVISDIDKPQLELMDFKGNISDDAKAPINAIVKNKPNKSD